MIKIIIEIKDQDVAQSCDIECMPAFHFYKKGKKLDKLSGSDQDELTKMLDEHKTKPDMTHSLMLPVQPKLQFYNQ
ncbi:thioredoxin-like [Carassius gibelio]|uniref:thioredoxin-like n=1 Tax=Carassius gibelio TaxID=101364 RepID=UPI002277AED9|nr:thioredoxin-like [Carassius gibelio]